MAGVVIADEDEPLLRTAVDACRSRLNVPPSRALHWNDHVKACPRRQYVTTQLAAVPITVNFVIFEKASIPPSARLAVDHVAFYNYVAGLMLERVVLTARYWPGGARDVTAHYGHVRGFDHADTANYFALKQASGGPWPPWHLLRKVQFTGMAAYHELQAADQYAGMLNAALCKDNYGGYEPQHLLQIRHQVRRRHGVALDIGFKTMTFPTTMTSYPWWPAEGI